MTKGIYRKFYRQATKPDRKKALKQQIETLWAIIRKQQAEISKLRDERH